MQFVPLPELTWGDNFEVRCLVSDLWWRADVNHLFDEATAASKRMHRNAVRRMNKIVEETMLKLQPRGIELG